MWFGDERGYNATEPSNALHAWQLWFGDERGYNATLACQASRFAELWFGDERGYNATKSSLAESEVSCGLVMKEDITQLLKFEHASHGVVVW